MPHYGKFNQENMYQTLSELAPFCKRYDKNISACFLVHIVYQYLLAVSLAVILMFLTIFEKKDKTQSNTLCLKCSPSVEATEMFIWGL